MITVSVLRITGAEMGKMLYMDYAATTPPSPEVVQKTLPWLRERVGNPSAVCANGQVARQAVEKAREAAAGLIQAEPEEIFFTSGGTEADNWVLERSCPYGKPSHIITSQIEHHAVLNTCKAMEKRGVRVSYIRPDENGQIRPRDIERHIRKDTRLISVMFANNEVGTIQPVAEIGALAQEYGIPFHTDAVQVVGHLPVDVNSWNITYLSASAHKFFGLKGCGFLYCKKGSEPEPLLFGGAQERGLRAGTENVAGIVALGEAARLCSGRLSWEAAALKPLRDLMIEQLEKISGSHLMGDRQKRLPGNVHVCFEGIDGRSLALLLQQEGICVSAGAACSSSLEEGSHVLEAMHVPKNCIRGALRISLGTELSRGDILYAAGRIRENVERLRTMEKSGRDADTMADNRQISRIIQKDREKLSTNLSPGKKYS